MMKVKPQYTKTCIDKNMFYFLKSIHQDKYGARIVFISFILYYQMEKENLGNKKL